MFPHRFRSLFLLFLMCATFSITAGNLITIRNGQFQRDGRPYYYIGTNLWYAPILASEGKGGNLPRLRAELDQLKSLGVENLRILVGADRGSSLVRWVQPVLQSEPGQLNDTLLRGLDRLLYELETREMTAVLYLTNSWDWSGGFGFYLREVGLGDSPSAEGDGWNDYVRYAAQFANNRAAQQLYFQFIQTILTRRNTVTQRLYKDEPSIFAWQLCNEPRPFGNDEATVEGFYRWTTEAAHLIKTLDPNHLVSLGSEGVIGCNVNEELYQRVHAHPDIDYLTLHIWPINWRWSSADRLYQSLPNVYVRSEEYIEQHVRLARRLGKPMVIEEFGYARDHNFRGPGGATVARDSFYAFIFSKVCEAAADGRHPLMGCNFWGWGGQGRPASTTTRPGDQTWQMGDDYLCDPPHEPQGWYSVYDTDTSTLKTIHQATKALSTK